MEVVLTALLLAGGGLIWFYVRKLRSQYDSNQDIANRLICLDQETHQTVAYGLYYRFKKDDEGETPLDFERFVAQIMEDCYGGSAYVTKSSGDFGVDIEHQRQGGLYLGQVKCYAPHNTVGFEPVAILHSQMVKQGARGGFVATTSRFTDNARSYAHGLNIELIEGEDMAHLWANAIEFKRSSAKSSSATTA